MRRVGVLFAVLVSSACFAPVGESGDGGTGGGSGGGAGGGSAGAGGNGPECSLDSECSHGMVCESCEGVKSCAPGCRSDADCGRPFTCQSGVQCKTCPCANAICALDPCLDADHDGFTPSSGSGCLNVRGGDCDDTNAQVHPGALEQCFNGRDDDCDGLTDAKDPDCLECQGGKGCLSSFDCQLGQTFCDKGGATPGPGPGCCAACPVFDNDCAVGFHVEPAGIDPMTGCRRVACVMDNGTVCPSLYAPVCATNGQTYGNSCELGRAGATQLHAGECLPGEGLDCGYNGSQACGTSGTLYCRDACPLCDAWVMRCTKVGVCVYDSDCPAGASTPACADGSVPHATCAMSACQYTCP